jgi:hypothetical protein
LLYKNPIDATQLDRLFADTLRTLVPQVQTAVIYSAAGKRQSSRTDTALFCPSAVALDEVRIGPSDEIILQAFVHLPFAHWVWKNAKTCSILLFAWLLSIALVFVISKKAPVFRRKSPLRTISKNLNFNERQGLLIYKGIHIECNGYPLRLFIFLLNASEYFQSYTEIRDEIWADSQVSLNTINKNIRRLREILSIAPELSINIRRGKGCQLIITENVDSKNR